MKVFDFVIVNFFTEKKRTVKLTLPENLDAVESTINQLGETLPDCIIAGYLNGELINAHRPHNVIKDRELVKEGQMSVFEFIVKWKMGFTGEQIFPDFSLPKRKTKRVQKEEPIASAKGRPQKPHRAKFREIVPQAAGA